MPSANPYDRRPTQAAEDRDEDASKAFGEGLSDELLRQRESGHGSQDHDADRGYAKSELSVLGPTVHFKGELSADEDLMIQGRVEGSIRHNASHLTVGAKGKVKANVHANHIVVQGEVIGDLYGTEAVIIEASARVRGNVFAPRVALHEGAKFKGSIDMEATEESKPSASAKSSTGSSARSKKSGTAKETVSDEKVDELLD